MKTEKSFPNEFKINIRKANTNDLTAIIELLADDPLGQLRENSTMPPRKSYIDAFNDILNDDNAEIFVVVTDKNIIGVAQINYLRYLTYQGGVRAQIEGVRIHKKHQISQQMLLEPYLFLGKLLSTVNYS